jgi:hypothetical protein
MEITTVNYLNLGFSWFMVLMSIWGYIAIMRNTGQRWGFWIWFGSAWILLGISHILTVVGISPAEGYFIAVRTCGYALMVISILSLMLRFVEADYF